MGVALREVGGGWQELNSASTSESVETLVTVVSSLDIKATATDLPPAESIIVLFDVEGNFNIVSLLSKK